MHFLHVSFAVLLPLIKNFDPFRLRTNSVVEILFHTLYTSLHGALVQRERLESQEST